MIADFEDRDKQIGQQGTRDTMTWREDFERQLSAMLPGTEIVAGPSARLWNTVSALMPATDSPQRWVVKLDKLGFAVSTGSACSSGKEEPSHVLQAMGYPPAAAARALRFSAGWETTASDWASLLQALQNVHRKIASGGEKFLAKQAHMQ
jgi:cysteine desulfurase